MKSGLYVHIEDAIEAADKGGERLKERLVEKAEIYVTEDGSIIRRAT